jgi:hypothetical protein
MSKEKEINEGQLTPEIVSPGQDFAEARWNALSQFGIEKPSGSLVRDLESNKKVLLQRGLTIKRAIPAPDMGTGIIQFIASTDGQKRDGNRVRNSGWHFENFAKNPVFLWCHDYRSLPIGRHVDWSVDKEGDSHVLRVWSQFCDPDLYAFADKIRKMYEAGFLRAGSIGWNPLKFDILRDKDGMFAGFDFVENDLLEFSAVPVPSDPDAIVEAISRGIIGDQDIEKIQEYGHLPKLSRGVAYTLSNFDPIPPKTITAESTNRIAVVDTPPVAAKEEELDKFMDQADEMKREVNLDDALRVVSDSTDLPLASRDYEWDASAADLRAREWAGGESMNWGHYGKAFFYADEENNESFKAYKLGYADVIDSELRAVPRAIFAVADALSGSHEGMDIPEKDASDIKSKVNAYYEKMAKEFDDESIVSPFSPSTEDNPEKREDVSLKDKKEGSEELDEHGNPVSSTNKDPENSDEAMDQAEDDEELDYDLQDIDEVIAEAFSEAASKVSLVISKMIKGHSLGEEQTRAMTNFPSRGEDKTVNLKNSNWPQFDRSFAERIKSDYPKIWKAGGNIYGNTAYRLWGEVRQSNGAPSTKEQEKWVRKREAWTARHFEDGRQFKDGKIDPNVSNIAGVVAQIKWGSIGTLGEEKMKDIVRALMKKLDEKRDVAETPTEVRVGKKVSNARLDKMLQMREAMNNAKDNMGNASNYLEDLLNELTKLDEKGKEDPHEQSPKEKVVYSVDEEYVLMPLVNDSNIQSNEADVNIEQLARLSSRLSEIENILNGRFVEAEVELEVCQEQAPVMDEFEARLARIKETVETLPTAVKPNTTKPKSDYVQSVMERIGLLKN